MHVKSMKDARHACDKEGKIQSKRKVKEDAGNSNDGRRDTQILITEKAAKQSKWLHFKEK